MSSLCNNKNIINRIYGEWLISHTNHPYLYNSNSIEIYPKKKLILNQSKYCGPILYSTKTYGKFVVDCNENCNIESDDDDDINCKLYIKWYEKKFFLESIFGIGINEIETQIFYESIPENMFFLINVIKPNNIYMTNDDNLYLHLVRNTLPDKKINNSTPLSSFVVSQVLGSIMLNILHHYFKNIF
jgi:hypothetical protein